MEYNNPYDNIGAHNAIKSIMLRKERINMQLGMDKGGYDCAWIESKTEAKFKYQLSEEGFLWLLNYMQKGATEDYGVKPSQVTPEENIGGDFQLAMLQAFIDCEFLVHCTPLFREVNGYISALASFANGKVLFRVKRTEVLIDYLREKGFAI